MQCISGNSTTRLITLRETMTSVIMSSGNYHMLIFLSHFSMIACYLKHSKREREMISWSTRHSSATDKLLVDHERSLIINVSICYVLPFSLRLIPPAPVKFPHTHKQAHPIIAALSLWWKTNKWGQSKFAVTFFYSNRRPFLTFSKVLFFLSSPSHWRNANANRTVTPNPGIIYLLGSLSFQTGLTLYVCFVFIQSCF